jgi:hypothetical protein
MIVDGYRRVGLAIALCVLLLAPALEAWQRFRRPYSSRSWEPVQTDEDAEFYFTRLVYGGYGGWGRRGGWATDYPDAEYHFMQGVRRLTSIDAAEGGRLVRPLDETIFDHPWIYAVEVGHWELDEQEAAQVREYLLRGGFLMVDDFHGTYEWAVFIDSMKRVFPDRPIVDLDPGESLMHVLYDLDEHLRARLQIPGIRYAWTGQTWERDGYEPHWRGIYDDEGRLLVAINFNMDVGDAWEHADTPEYPERMTALAYRFGINYIIYAMTH